MSDGVGILADRDIDAECSNCGCEGFRHCPHCCGCLDCAANCDINHFPIWPRVSEAATESED